MKAKVRLSIVVVFDRCIRRRALPLMLLLWLFAGALNGTPAVAQAVVLVGSGSTVPALLYNRWAQEFGKRNPKIQMRYVPIGTSEGIKQISHGAGDFAAGEAPLTEKDRKDANLIDLPVVLIGIVPVYNLPNTPQELRLSGDVLAEIFLGTIKTWNAPQLTKLNPDLALPNLPIRVINRPGGKGSNYVFTDFLSKSSARFRSEVGVSTSPKWPVGESAERSSDMADKVKSEPGAIGYVELQYALKANIAQAAVLNAAGKFVRATAHGLVAACEDVEAPRWHNFSASLINAKGADSFPITSFTWIYLRTESSDRVRTSALVDLLHWIYSDGQAFAAEEGYTQLPPQLLEAVRTKVTEIRR